MQVTTLLVLGLATVAHSQFSPYWSQQTQPRGTFGRGRFVGNTYTGSIENIPLWSSQAGNTNVYGGVSGASNGKDTDVTGYALGLTHRFRRQVQFPKLVRPQWAFSPPLPPRFYANVPYEAVAEPEIAPQIEQEQTESSEPINRQRRQSSFGLNGNVGHGGQWGVGASLTHRFGRSIRNLPFPRDQSSSLRGKRQVQDSTRNGARFGRNVPLEGSVQELDEQTVPGVVESVAPVAEHSNPTNRFRRQIYANVPYFPIVEGDRFGHFRRNPRTWRHPYEYTFSEPAVVQEVEQGGQEPENQLVRQRRSHEIGVNGNYGGRRNWNVGATYTYRFG